MSSMHNAQREAFAQCGPVAQNAKVWWYFEAIVADYLRENPETKEERTSKAGREKKAC